MSFDRANWVHKEILRSAKNIDETTLTLLNFLQDIWALLTSTTGGTIGEPSAAVETLTAVLNPVEVQLDSSESLTQMVRPTRMAVPYQAWGQVGMEQAMRIFVSYTATDTDWAEWIAWGLESAGHQVTIQAWDFLPGTNFVLEMQRASSSADRIVLVMSPAALTSDFVAAEWSAGFSLDPAGSTRRLVPMRVRECEPDGLLKQIVWVDLVGLSLEKARASVIAAVADERLKPIGPPKLPGEDDARTSSINVSNEARDIEGALRWFMSDQPTDTLDLFAMLSITPNPEPIIHRWQESTFQRVSFAIGLDSQARLTELSLQRDGPCGAIVGPSGAGTSELLRTICMSLALTYPPERIRFHLADFKGGGTWWPIRHLPHVDNLFELHQDGAVARVKDGLGRLVDDKYDALSRSGFSTIGEHNESGASPLPLDVFLVDEIAHDAVFLDALVRFQQVGRSLGMHVIVGTQNRAALSPAFESLNRFVLAMGNSLENWADYIPPHVLRIHEDLVAGERYSRPGPGRGFWIQPGETPVPFQAAVAGAWTAGRLDDPFLMNSVLEEQVEAVRVAAVEWSLGETYR